MNYYARQREAWRHNLADGLVLVFQVMSRELAHASGGNA